MAYTAQVIDLCGRTAPFVAEIDCLDLSDADIEHILNQWAEGKPAAYIGEIEYREVDSANSYVAPDGQFGMGA